MLLDQQTVYTVTVFAQNVPLWPALPTSLKSHAQLWTPIRFSH